MNADDRMTREDFLAQYKGEWAPSEGLWLGLDFSFNGCEYRFQTESMYTPQNLTLPDGREARFYMYRKVKSNSCNRYELLSAFAAPIDVVEKCVIDGRTFGQLLDDNDVVLLGQD